VDATRLRWQMFVPGSVVSREVDEHRIETGRRLRKPAWRDTSVIGSSVKSSRRFTRCTPSRCRGGGPLQCRPPSHLPSSIPSPPCPSQRYDLNGLNVDLSLSCAPRHPAIL